MSNYVFKQTVWIIRDKAYISIWHTNMDDVHTFVPRRRQTYNV